MTNKKYGVILADPPWGYSVNKGNGVANNHYSTMTCKDLLDLPIGEMGKDDSILLMWATWPFWPFALDLVKKWGYEYKTVIPWLKIKNINVNLFDKQADIMTQWGVGFWARGCSEPLIIAKRGNASHPNDPPLGLITDREGYIFLGPRLQHSRKLNSVYEYASLFDGPYLELFARRSHPGWDVWGNEVESDIVLPIDTK